MSKQTAVELIFKHFNLLSNAEFRTWMLNNYEVIMEVEKDMIINALLHPINGYQEQKIASIFDIERAEQYYNETYKGGEQ